MHSLIVNGTPSMTSCYNADDSIRMKGFCILAFYLQPICDYVTTDAEIMLKNHLVELHFIGTSAITTTVGPVSITGVCSRHK